MDNYLVKGSKPGYHYQLKGRFVWWPVRVTRGRPWPKEVPILGPTGFHKRRPDGSWSRDSPDKRLIDEWAGGFPFDKQQRVYEAIKQAIKQVTGRGIGGSYKVWMWADKQDAKTLAAVWNLAMRDLGYDV